MSVRGLGFSAVLLSAALALGQSSQAVAAHVITAQFHGGPDRAGVFSGVGPEGFFKPVWRFDAGHMVIASPVVADRVLFVGAKNGNFYALDAASGALKWKFVADAPITSTAAIIDGAAVFQSDANTIYALAVSDGHELWHRATGASLPFEAIAGFDVKDDWDYWSSSPLAYKGRIYIGSGDGKVYALDAKTGDIKWSYATDGRVRSSPATDGKRIYAGNLDGEMFALEIRNGHPLWSFKARGNPIFPQGSIVSSPALGGGKVYFGSRDFNLYALEAKSGKESWHQAVKNSWVPTTPAFSNGALYAGSADGRAVFAFDAKSGKQLWTNSLDSQLLFSSPIIAGNKVYAATTGGYVFALTAKDGKIAGYTMTQDRVMSSPWIENGIIYFGDNDGFVYAMSAGAQHYPGG
ncbi:MAG: PQQ-binding-like beta-propeller repeat protein [Alphaproteobacteria bacterium]